MKATKTLNISPALHKQLKILAVEAGWQLGEYVDAIIEVGIRHRADVKLSSAADTKQESPPEPR